MDRLSRLAVIDGGLADRDALFADLCDDRRRARLYEEMARAGRTVRRFTSRVSANSAGRQLPAWLLTGGDDIRSALKHFSVTPYALLGGGEFMLAIDDPVAHERQRKLAAAALHFSRAELTVCIELAWKQAAVLVQKRQDFDLANLAEQVAARCMRLLFGIPDEDHNVMVGTLQRAHTELCFAIIGRHFVDELEPRRQLPPDVEELKPRLVKLLAAAQHDRPADPDALPRARTVLARLAVHGDGFTQEQLAVIAIGLLAGTVGNVQAGVCIVLAELFRPRDGKPPLIDEARASARKVAQCEARGEDCASALQPLREMVDAALLHNPPAAFLTRQADGVHVIDPDTGAPLPKGSTVLLALGAAQDRSLVFGGDTGDRDYVHQCVGEHLARPLILHIVRQVLLLPGMAQVIDAASGRPRPLQKRWGIQCQQWPLQFDRARVLRQQPLTVIMKIRAPVAENAYSLKKLIEVGAPQIEQALADSNHVHFAWFVLVDDDTRLALHTVFDGDFDAYIEDFALKVKLFDRLFEYLEGAPQLPVRSHPKEFIATIQRHRKTPVGSYFFSAYPQASVSDLNHALARGRP